MGAESWLDELERMFYSPEHPFTMAKRRQPKKGETQ